MKTFILSCLCGVALATDLPPTVSVDYPYPDLPHVSIETKDFSTETAATDLSTVSVETTMFETIDLSTETTATDLPTDSVETTATDLSTMSVEAVQDLLKQWRLHEKFGNAFRNLGYDGRVLRLLSEDDWKQELFPDSTRVQWKVLLEEIAHKKEEHREIHRQARRLGPKKVDTSKYVGLRVKRDQSLVSFGKASDVQFVRTGPKELSLYANVFKLKSLDSDKITLGGKDLNGLLGGGTLVKRLKAVEDTLKKLKADAAKQELRSRHSHAMAMCMGAGGIGEYRSIITLNWHKNIGAKINEQCHKSINGGWHACGVVKDNYHGQACSKDFGGSISSGSPSASGGSGGGYQSFITRQQVAAGKWAGKGTCDHDAVWICCSPQCDTKTGKPNNNPTTKLANSLKSELTKLSASTSALKSELTKLSASTSALKTALAQNAQKDVTGHAMAMCMGATQSSRSFRSIILLTWHTSIGKNINKACTSGINGGWRACGVVKDNYKGQACSKDFGGSLRSSPVGKGGKQGGGYQSFITRAEVEKHTWHAKGTCDHDSVWICCSPQC